MRSANVQHKSVNIYAELCISAKKEWVQFSSLIILDRAGKSFKCSHKDICITLFSTSKLNFWAYNLSKKKYVPDYLTKVIISEEMSKDFCKTIHNISSHSTIKGKNKKCCWCKKWSCLSVQILPRKKLSVDHIFTLLNKHDKSFSAHPKRR